MRPGKCQVVGWAPIKRFKEPIVRVPQFKGDFWIGPRSCLYEQVMQNGVFEPEQTKACLAHLDRGKDAIDVGANIGFYTVLFAKTLDVGKRVLAVEPVPVLTRRLYGNLVLNKVDDQVILYRGAVLDHEGEAAIHIIDGKEEYSSTGAMPLPATAGAACTTVDVSVTTVDALVELHGLEPGFVKIDVEGREPAVLAGMDKTIRKHRPVILTEFWPASLVGAKHATQKDIHAALAKHGYTAQIIDGYDFLCLPNE